MITGTTFCVTLHLGVPDQIETLRPNESQGVVEAADDTTHDDSWGFDTGVLQPVGTTWTKGVEGRRKDALPAAITVTGARRKCPQGSRELARTRDTANYECLTVLGAQS